MNLKFSNLSIITTFTLLLSLGCSQPSPTPSVTDPLNGGAVDMMYEVAGERSADMRPDEADEGPPDMMPEVAGDDLSDMTPEVAGDDLSDMTPEIAGELLSDMSPPPDQPFSASEDVYALDHELRLNHLQALGTHNSYHLASHVDILPWRYSHLPLGEQLGLQGVRQFELDIYERDGVFRVYHLDQIDFYTTCETLVICLQQLRVWSDDNRFHHPMLVLFEVKSLERSPEQAISALEELLAEVWSLERLLTPRLVQRDSPTLREGLERGGWPTLGEVRGRLMPVLHAGGELRDALLNAPGGLAERLFFPDAYGDLSASFAAYHSMNDPISGLARIQAVVAAGHLVRTRTDVNGEETVELDYTRAEHALESGAHWLSTDYPLPATPMSYGFVIPEGQPSRCHPTLAPPQCTSDQLE